jgi:hypothetical protein
MSENPGRRVSTLFESRRPSESERPSESQRPLESRRRSGSRRGRVSGGTLGPWVLGLVVGLLAGLAWLRRWPDDDEKPEEAPCPPNDERIFCGAVKTGLSDVIGFSALITTRRVVLPCEPTGRFPAASFAFVGTEQRDGFERLARWAQVGYVRARGEKDPKPVEARYLEVCGDATAAESDPSVVHREFFPPLEDGAHRYEGLLDPATGRWEFRYDGAVFHEFTGPAWKGKSGSTAAYIAEILHRKSQMVGTASDPCRFSECRYRVASEAAFRDAGLADGDLKGAVAGEWANRRVDGTTVEVWDEAP